MRHIRKGLVLATEDARDRGEQEERESGVEVARVLGRVHVRHAPVGRTRLPARPLGLYDDGRDMPDESVALPPEGADFADLKVHLDAHQTALRDAARDLRDAVYDALHAPTEEALHDAIRRELKAHDAVCEALRATGEVYLHARGEKKVIFPLA